LLPVINMKYAPRSWWR